MDREDWFSPGELKVRYDTLDEAFVAKCTSQNRRTVANRLRMADVKQGFVLSKDQFIHMSRHYFSHIRDNESGMWSNVEFYPKSGHMVIREGNKWIDGERHVDVIYPTYGMTKDCPYFRWVHGPGAGTSWMKVYVKFRNKSFDYIVFAYVDGDLECRIFHDDALVIRSVHIGGGRGYSEEHAMPYRTFGKKTIVE